MGMVLSAATIGEYDKRIVLLTKERGRISAFARGARRPRSPLSASTEPFTFGEFYIYRGRDSYSVEQVEVKNFFPELRKDLDVLYMAFYFCEVADYFTREGMDAGAELNLLYLSLRALTVPSLPNKLVRYIYEFRMLSIQGEAPRIFSCIRCGGTGDLHHFSIQENGIVCDSCCARSGSQQRSGLPAADTAITLSKTAVALSETAVALSETALYTLQRILSSPIEKLYTFTVGDNILAELEQAAGRYFKAHTDREFRSGAPF